MKFVKILNPSVGELEHKPQFHYPATRACECNRLYFGILMNCFPLFCFIFYVNLRDSRILYAIKKCFAINNFMGMRVPSDRFHSHFWFLTCLHS